MDDNNLPSRGIVSISLIEAKLPLRLPHGVGVEPGTSGGDPLALWVPRVAVFLETVSTRFPVVPPLVGRAGAAGAVVHVYAAAGDRAGDAPPEIRHVHLERTPSFPGRIEADGDGPRHVGVCECAGDVIRVGRFHVGLKAFHAEFSGTTKGLG